MTIPQATMDTTEQGNGDSSRKPWSDRDKLTYLVLLMERGSLPIDWKTAPIPEGRTVVACQRMIQKLPGQFKTDIEAMMSGASNVGPAASTEDGEPAPKTPRKRGPRKKKVDEDGNPLPETPKRTPKRGRKPKAEPGEESPTKKTKMEDTGDDATQNEA